MMICYDAFLPCGIIMSNQLGAGSLGVAYIGCHIDAVNRSMHAHAHAKACISGRLPLPGRRGEERRGLL